MSTISTTGVAGVQRSLAHSLDGLRRHQKSLNETSERLAATAPLGDTAGDIVQLGLDARGFQANARAARVADELVGNLIDVLA